MTPPASDEEKEEVARFLCPLTRTIMQDPVTIREGHTFERTALLKFIEKYGEISPISGKPLGAPCFYASKMLSWDIHHWQIDMQTPAEEEKEESNGTPVEASVVDQAQPAKQQQEPVQATINDPVEQEEEKEEVARFLCPLTRTIMQDPVTIREGHTFERTALLKFIEKHGEVSPNSGKPLGTPCFYASKMLSWEIHHWKIDMQTPVEAEKEESNGTPVEASVVDQAQSTKQQQEPLQATIKSKTITIPSAKKMSPETSPHRGSISHQFIEDSGILGNGEEQDVLSILDQACSLQMEAY
jgi:hypothetical protein